MPLTRAAGLLVALLVAHVADHERQGRPIPAPAAALGLAGLAAAVVVLVLAARRSRWAPDAAMLVGAATVGGFVAIHFVPHWSALSDPYADMGVDALSWASAIITALAGALLAAVGARRRDSIVRRITAR